MSSQPLKHIDSSQYFRGAGEMAERTRNYDWTSSILGEPGGWSPSLLTTVNIILQSKFPMFLWWGPELIQFYNDAYRPSLGNEGKHPSALGQRGEECWPEIWPIIKPLIDSVRAGGEATWSEDALIPIYRNNQLEDVYWTFSYSRVEDALGGEGGILVVCSETTEKVMSRRTLEETVLALAHSESRLRYLMEDAPVSIAVLTGRELIVESANRKMLETWGKSKTIVGLPLERAIPELRGQPFLELLVSVFDTGIAYYGNEVKAMLEQHSVIEEVYSNFVYQPLKNERGETNGIMVVANVITEQVLARNQLQKAQDLLKLAIDTAGIGTWSADLRTGVLTISNRARNIHGIPLGQEITLDQSLGIIAPAYVSQVRALIEKAVKTAEGFDTEYLIHPLDGSKPKWLRANGKAYYDETGQPHYITGTMIDITEQKMDELRKNDFIAMVSHELKTPLSSLSAIIQLLYAKTKAGGEAVDVLALEKGFSQVKRMTSLINGFLNVSRLESGKIQVQKTFFSIQDLISELVKEVVLTNPGRQINFEPGIPVFLMADEDKIGSVIMNLINNAMKYSPRNSAVDIACEEKDNQVFVSVRDYGRGISEDDQARIFERYYRVENEANRHVSGFGIGLYLSAEIIHRHGGNIFVESEAGNGARFIFSLPRG